MNKLNTNTERFRLFFVNNKGVITLLILLLIGLNIFLYTKINFIFNPLIVLLKTIFLPVLLSGVAYYLLNPIVDYGEKKGISRIYSILVLYVAVIGIIVVLMIFVVPFLRGQLNGLAQDFPSFIERIKQLAVSFFGSERIDTILSDFGINLSSLTGNLTDNVTNLLQTSWATLKGVVGAVTETLLAIVMVPLILFYLLKDGKKLPYFISKFLPVKHRDGFAKVLNNVNYQISTYIRGQILVSFCIGLLLYIGYNIIGLEYSLILALIAACTAIVPFVGPAIAITPAVIVALFTSPFMLLKMIVVWTVAQLLEGKFISPQILGKRLHIHPISILFIILTGGHLFGVMGVILAVPGYAVLKVLVVSIFKSFSEKSILYK